MAFSAKKGFTLLELLIVLAIIAILAAYIAPKIMNRPEEAKRTMAGVQIQGLETALKIYKLDNGMYPSTEQGLSALVAPPTVGNLPAKWRKGGYLERDKVPKDPWGNAYIYICPGVHGDFDIISRGADGLPGGEGADADINSWDMQN
jgi:general secretion pathway protein G